MNRLSYGDNLDILRKDVPDDGGELVYLAPPFKHNKDRSILERKRAEEALFVEKERAEVTLNSIGDAVLSTDISGNVTYLNVVAESMSGSTRVEASGRPLAEVFNIVDGTTRQSPKHPEVSYVFRYIFANLWSQATQGSQPCGTPAPVHAHPRPGAMAR